MDLANILHGFSDLINERIADLSNIYQIFWLGLWILLAI